MALAKLVDIGNLLAPVSETNPIGQDIREDPSPTSIYQDIRNARNTARTAERHSLFGSDDNNTADSRRKAEESWRKILDLAPDILTNYCKDLEVASWYTEALVRRYGFYGLRYGFELIHELIKLYWEKILPMPDEYGMETRVAPLAGLNGEGNEGVLIAPIRNIALTQGQPPGPFSFWQYQQAREVQKISDQEAREKSIAKLGFSQNIIDKAVAESDDNFFVDQRNDLQDSIDFCEQTNHLLNEYCDIEDVPPISNIINVLQDCLGVINHLGKGKFPVELDVVDNPDSFVESASQPEQNFESVISNRETAFQQLRDISEFFRKTEPHSPISYVIEKALKWGDMPLNELMLELIPDTSSREHYNIITGVTAKSE